MDIDKFKEAEAKYLELKSQLDKGEIDATVMKKKLKEIMLTDDSGNYWMIGGKSGKWYNYRDSEWKEDNPYPEEALQTQQLSEGDTVMVDRKEKQILIDDSTEFVICKVCKSKISPHSVYCHICGANQKEPKKTETVTSLKAKSEILIKSIKLVPMIFFFGGLGLILGVLLGATFGIFDIFGDFIFQFPIMLQETRGKIQGGLIFAAMGGISGFILLAFFSVIVTGIYNFISFFFGGIRFKIKS
ncbi:MAG: hypothetical protein KAT17_01855 [Candidatus Aminicenantes bacterium]|nr:hypothetical protein [Candidatus Aminicenantes bacterium]